MVEVEVVEREGPPHLNVQHHDRALEPEVDLPVTEVRRHRATAPDQHRQQLRLLKVVHKVPLRTMSRVARLLVRGPLRILRVSLLHQSALRKDHVNE